MSKDKGKGLSASEHEELAQYEVPDQAEVWGPAPSRDEVMAARTRSGGWTKEILARWGIEWPAQSGWIDRLHARHLRGEAVKRLTIKPTKAKKAKPTQPSVPAPSTPSPWPTTRYQDAQGRWWNPIVCDYMRDIGTPDPDDPPPWM
jgi:hypothetical protein